MPFNSELTTTNVYVRPWPSYSVHDEPSARWLIRQPGASLCTAQPVAVCTSEVRWPSSTKVARWRGSGNWPDGRVRAKSFSI
jgi:hypothetical protein